MFVLILQIQGTTAVNTELHLNIDDAKLFANDFKVKQVFRMFIYKVM